MKHNLYYYSATKQFWEQRIPLLLRLFVLRSKAFNEHSKWFDLILELFYYLLRRQHNVALSKEVFEFEIDDPR